MILNNKFLWGFLGCCFFFDGTFIKAQDSENKEGLRVKKQEESLLGAAVS